MEDKKRGEIALAILKMLAEKRGLNLKPEEIKREIPNISKATLIPEAELKDFAKEIVTELVVKSFGSK